MSERTGGVPLFVEEVTRLLVERGELGGVQAIPPTLQQLLAARLDRLGAAREAAQIGSVLGRDFVMRYCKRWRTSTSRAAIVVGAPCRGGHPVRRRRPPQANYRFKHALIQDAAYDSLLKSRRQALHRRAAEVLREGASPEPEAIAHHFTQAGLDDLAIEWWGKAGDQALRRSAFQEAIAHLGKAIAMADRAGRCGGRRARPGRACHSCAPPTATRCSRREAMARRNDGAFAEPASPRDGEMDAPERFAADYGLWVGSYVRGELSSMRACARLSSATSRRARFAGGRRRSSRGRDTCWFAGEYREARIILERALALFLPGRDDDLAFRFGQDPGVAAMLYLALVLWPLGDVDARLRFIRDALARIACLTHVFTHRFRNMHAALFELMRGDPCGLRAEGL